MSELRGIVRAEAWLKEAMIAATVQGHASPVRYLRLWLSPAGTVVRRAVGCDVVWSASPATRAGPPAACNVFSWLWAQLMWTNGMWELVGSIHAMIPFLRLCVMGPDAHHLRNRDPKLLGSKDFWPQCQCEQV